MQEISTHELLKEFRAFLSNLKNNRGQTIGTSSLDSYLKEKSTAQSDIGFEGWTGYLIHYNDLIRKDIQEHSKKPLKNEPLLMLAALMLGKEPDDKVITKEFLRLVEDAAASVYKSRKNDNNTVPNYLTVVKRFIIFLKNYGHMGTDGAQFKLENQNSLRSAAKKFYCQWMRKNPDSHVNPETSDGYFYVSRKDLDRLASSRIKTQDRYYGRTKDRDYAIYVSKRIFNAVAPDDFRNWYKTDINNSIFHLENATVRFHDVAQLRLKKTKVELERKDEPGRWYTVYTPLSERRITTTSSREITAQGTSEMIAALPSEISIDHIIPLENLISQNIGELPDLRKLSDILKDCLVGKKGADWKKQWDDTEGKYFTEDQKKKSTDLIKHIVKHELFTLSTLSDPMYQWMELSENSSKGNGAKLTMNE